MATEQVPEGWEKPVSGCWSSGVVCHLLPIFLQALEGVRKLRSQVSLSPTCVSVPYLEFAAPSPLTFTSICPPRIWEWKRTGSSAR